MEASYKPEEHEISFAQKNRIQEAFFNYCRRKKIPLKLTLAGNITEEGYIVGFDRECIIFSAHNTEYLHFKSAIYSIRPQVSIKLTFRAGKQKGSA